MRFGYSIYYVANVKDTIAFYETAFGLTRGLVTEGNEYGELETGDTKLAFAANTFVRTLTPQAFTEASPDTPAPPISIALVTDHVDEAYARALHAGAIDVLKPAAKPWGQIVAYVRDNNGYLIELCSPMR